MSGCAGLGVLLVERFFLLFLLLDGAVRVGDIAKRFKRTLHGYLLVCNKLAVPANKARTCSGGMSGTQQRPTISPVRDAQSEAASLLLGSEPSHGGDREAPRHFR
jgi:hypothetical protein